MRVVLVDKKRFSKIMEMPDQTDLSRIPFIKIVEPNKNALAYSEGTKKCPTDHDIYLKELTFRHHGDVNDDGLLIYEEI
jgi:hypothetical protein